MMKEQNSKVSVVMPVYNAAGFLSESISGVLQQSYSNLQLIVVDDGSKDESLDILKFFEKQDDRILVVSMSQNVGVACARNRGIELADGRYIAFCDADDIWLPIKLQAQIELMEQTGSPIAHANFIANYEDKRVEVKGPKIVTYESLQIRNWICNSSGIYDAHIVGKRLQQDMVHEDYEMWAGILRNGYSSVACQKPLLILFRGEGRLTSSRLWSLVHHIIAQRKIFGIGYVKVLYFLCINITWRISKRLF